MANERGWWKLVLNSDTIELSDVDREHIGISIREGFTEGEIVRDDPPEDPPVRVATIPARSAFTWRSQVHQYAATGEPGVSYEVNYITSGPVGVAADGTSVVNPPVDCLLWRDPDGVLRGILNHYPVTVPPHEIAGNLNVWVDPEWQRRGVATALVNDAMTRWSIDLGQQKYTPAGAAFTTAWEQRRQTAGSESKTEERNAQ